MIKRLIVLSLLVAGCKHTQPTEPVIITKEVKVPVPVPCPALKELGAEPEYPDTDAALRAAPDLFTRVQLLLQGRLLRIKRLAEHEVVKRSCQ